MPAAAQAKVKSSTKGELGLSARAFEPDDLDDTEDLGAAVEARLQAKVKAKPVRFQARVFTRTGLVDSDRSHLIVEEAWLQWRHRPWKLRIRAGWQLLNWTATEAFHPADVINSRNLDSDVENPEKLGEPMVSARLKVADGSVSAYYMPYRISPILPGPSSRLSFIPRGVPTPERPDPDRAHQGAVRVAQTLGGADIAVHAVRHEERGFFGWDRMTQLGLTYAHVLDEWVVKVEAAKRMFDDDARPGHYQVAAGAEWGWTYAGAGEGTVLAEGQAVIGAETAAERKAIHPFQRDILLGYRHTWDDVAGTELLVGVMFDLEDEQALGNLNFKRRLGDSFTVEASLRAIHAPVEPDTPAFGLQTLDGVRYAQLSLRHHF